MLDDRWLWLYAAFIVAAIVFSVVPASEVAHVGGACPLHVSPC